MTSRRMRMLEDKHLRDSARALIDADIKTLKSNFAHKGLGERALAALIAAIVVWFARHPILELFGIDTDADDEDGGYYPRSEH